MVDELNKYIQYLNQSNNIRYVIDVYNYTILKKINAMIYLNLSTLGEKVTGLGVYSQTCGEILESNFSCKTFHNKFYRKINKDSIQTPVSISIGYDKYASLRRLIYKPHITLNNDDYAYSPTHHSFFPPEKSIITIHDLISIHYPRQHPLQYLFFSKLIKYNINSFPAIFTVSETSKDEIHDYYKVSKSKIYVIPNSVSFGNLNILKNNSTKYILCVGASYPHKNIEELLLVHDIWKSKYKLIIVSAGGAYKNKILNLIDKLNIQDFVEIYGFVEHSHLENLYSSCEALIYPSLCEGFGIPPLEAIAHGKPCILSDIPVHREIFNNVGIFVKLGDKNSWFNAFNELLNDSSIKKILSTGNLILKKFTKENVEEKLKDAISMVTNCKNKDFY